MNNETKRPVRARVIWLSGGVVLVVLLLTAMLVSLFAPPSNAAKSATVSQPQYSAEFISDSAKYVTPNATQIYKAITRYGTPVPNLTVLPVVTRIAAP